MNTTTNSMTDIKGKRYAVVLHPDTEDGGFWIDCPALPGCSSQGDTVEEALAMIKDAIEGHVCLLRERDGLRGSWN